MSLLRQNSFIATRYLHKFFQFPNKKKTYRTRSYKQMYTHKNEFTVNVIKIRGN